MGEPAAAWNTSTNMSKAPAPDAVSTAAGEAHSKSNGQSFTSNFHPPVSRLHTKLYTMNPAELGATTKTRVPVGHNNLQDRVQMGTMPLLSNPAVKDELYLKGRTTHPGKLTETVVIPDETGLHPHGKAVIMPHHIPRPACKGTEDHLQPEPSGLSATCAGMPAFGKHTYPGGPGGAGHLVQASATVVVDTPVTVALHIAPQDHTGKMDHLVVNPMLGNEAVSHNGAELEPPAHDQRKFEAGRNHQAQMYAGNLGQFDTGFSIRKSREEQPSPIAHAGKMCQETEQINRKYVAKAHAGEMVRESLGGFASWLTAPLPNLRGKKAEGQTTVSALHNSPHGMEASSGTYRRMLHAPPPLAVETRGTLPAVTSPTRASRRSPGSKGSPRRQFLKAPWADWDF